MQKNILTLGLGTLVTLAASQAGAQTIPPALLDNSRYVVFEIGSSQHNDEALNEDFGEALEGDTSASNPTNTPITTSRASVMRVTTVLRGMDVSAGAPSKEVVAPLPPERGLNIYAEFDWSAIYDNRGLDLNGNKFAPRIGGDMLIGPEILIGGSFTYGFEKRRSDSFNIRNEESSFAFNGYIGKNFLDWINVGVTGTYAYEHQITKAFGGTFYGKNHVMAISPFVGVAHTYGAFSFSSTATYIYQHNDISIDSNPPVALGNDLDSHFYLHINEIEYALTDKLTLGANANFNVVIDETQNALTAAVNSNDDFWVTLGAKASYQLFDYITTSVQFQADVANEDYDNYLTSFGITWSF